ncbi:MAG TPA: SDR family NAD(P)-dependent oxidoreductase, partial [Acidimicrobiales bacterium]|nr:SDR family NAD(P)-dependent oxidoreductase [Acidimicrobiales bacterium]
MRDGRAHFEIGAFRMSDGRLSGRVVAVFGGTGALGSAVVSRLISDGADVAVADVEVPGISDRLDGASYRAVNALDEASVGGFFSRIGEPAWGVVNVIGGYTPGQAVVDLDLDVLRHQLDLNLVTAATITKAAIDVMKGARDPADVAAPRGGRILHTSSRVARGDGKDSF